MLEKILRIGEKIIPKSIYAFFQPAYHFFLAVTGNIIYGFPGRKLKVVGVTGTNGKSTTVDLITQILKEKDYKVGMISTIAFEIAGKRIENLTNRTTLVRWQTPKMLGQMIKAGCEYAVLEVASEGIAWYRVWGIPFDIAVFTNLSPEHLNFHKTMENYRNTKGKLFSGLKRSMSKNILKVSVVNLDDKEAKYFLEFSADKKIGFGIKISDQRSAISDKVLSTVSIKDVELIHSGSKFKLVTGNKNIDINLKLLGEFNIYNALAGAAVGISQNIDLFTIKKALEKVKGIAGRMESINEGQNFNVIIDYAVTPDAFSLLFKTLRSYTKGKIISVFGATGDRDKWKRPKMGEIAAKETDIVVVTDEEPYKEDPEKIIDEVYQGAIKIRKKDVYRISDRGEAIKFALRKAKNDDCVVITGIGHQEFRNVGDKKVPWNERGIVRKELKKLKRK